MKSSFPESSPLHCAGPLNRRGFMRVGLAGFGMLSWPGLLRLRAENALKPAQEKTAIILVWLPGGLSHLDSYDPKPDSGIEYRGPFKTIGTKVPGTRITELFPRHAAMADKFTILRSMCHTAPGHPAGSMQMWSGDSDVGDKPAPKFPDWMTVANFMRSQGPKRVNPLPHSISVLGSEYRGPAYVGSTYSPFLISNDPNRPDFEVPNIGLANASEAKRLSDRVALRKGLDTLERAFDKEGELGAVDEFEAQAMGLLTSPSARDAFDLGKEDARIRDRYGRNRWGQQLLLARRLVESGVDIVTSDLTGDLCGGNAYNWDDHAVNSHIFDAYRFRANAYDQAVTALIEDIYARGLDKRVLVVVTGEFGHTPKISFNKSLGIGAGSSGPVGTMQPGRDHWPRAFSNLWAGGGIQTGGVIGASDRRGEDVIERPCSPGDFLSTIYHHLGIDPKMHILDFNGRPTALVNEGKAIPELVGRSV